MSKTTTALALLSVSTTFAAATADADRATGPDVFVEDTPVQDPHDTGNERFAALGVLVAPAGNWFGLRAQLDLWTIAGASIGVAGTLFGRGDDVIGDERFKASGVAYLAYAIPIARDWKLRAQLGFGEALTIGEDATTRMAATTTYEIVEASVLATYRANHDWSIVGGPIVQRPVNDNANADNAMTDTTTSMVFVGLTRRW